MKPSPGPRYPLKVGDRVLHMDGRAGQVIELFRIDQLPYARVRWLRDDDEETLPLGYLGRATTEAI